jgi:hypothetical protein
MLLHQCIWSFLPVSLVKTHEPTIGESSDEWSGDLLRDQKSLIIPTAGVEIEQYPMALVNNAIPIGLLLFYQRWNSFTLNCGELPDFFTITCQLSTENAD